MKYSIFDSLSKSKIDNSDDYLATLGVLTEKELDGRILHHLPAMNGYVELNLPKSRRPESVGLREHVMILKKVNTDLVVGLAALIAKFNPMGLKFTTCSMLFIVSF